MLKIYIFFYQTRKNFYQEKMLTYIRNMSHFSEFTATAISEVTVIEIKIGTKQAVN